MNRAHIASLARDVQAHADIIAGFASREGVSNDVLWRESHAHIALIALRLQWMIDNLGPEPESTDPLTAILGTERPKPMAGVHTLGDRASLSGRVPRFGQTIKPDKPSDDAA